MAITTKGKKYKDSKKKKPVISMNKGGKAGKPVNEMDYLERVAYINEKYVSHLKDASMTFVISETGHSYDLTDQNNAIKGLLKYYEEQADFTEASLEANTNYKVDEWEIVRISDNPNDKETIELEEIDSGNTYNGSYLGAMDLNWRVYHDIENDKWFTIIHPHLGGDIRGGYGDAFILEGDDKDELFYRFYGEFVSGMISVYLTFDDGSEVIFDSEQDSDVHLFRVEQVETTGEKRISTLFVNDFNFYNGNYEGDEFIIETVDQYNTEKNIEKKNDGGAVAQDESPVAYIKLLGHSEGKWFELSDYSDGDGLVEGIEEWIEELNEEKGGSREEWEVRDWKGFMEDEYSIDNMVQPSMSESDFDEVYEAYEEVKNSDFPLEVIKEYMSDAGVSNILDAISNMNEKYSGSYSDGFREYARQLVDEGVYVPSANDMYVSETDIRLISNEEADNRVEDMSFEDALSTAEMTGEFDERNTELDDELEVLQDRLDTLETQMNESDGDDFDVNTEAIAEVEDEITEKETEISDLESEMDDEVREKAREVIAAETTDRLENDLEGFLSDFGYENPADVNFVQIDYNAIASDLESEYNIIRSHGEDYIFSFYGEGGKVIEAGKPKDYKFYVVEMSRKKIVQGFQTKEDAKEGRKKLSAKHKKSRFSVYPKSTIESKYKLDTHSNRDWMDLKAIEHDAKVSLRKIRSGSIRNEFTAEGHKVQEKLSTLRKRMTKSGIAAREDIKKDIEKAKADWRKLTAKNYQKTGNLSLGGMTSRAKSGARKVGQKTKAGASWINKQWSEADFGDGKGKAKFSGGGELEKGGKENYNKVVGRIGDEFHFVDYIFKHEDNFMGATGTTIMPVSKEQYELATSREGLEERFYDAMGEEEWLQAFGLDYDDFESDDDIRTAIVDGIESEHYAGQLDPFEEPDYKITEQMRELGFSENEFPIFEVIGGGRIFSVDDKYDEVYDKKLLDRIILAEESKLANGGMTYSNGGEITEQEISTILDDVLTDATEEVDSNYEIYEWTGEDVETKFRDGFIPHTDGGFVSRGFATMSSLSGSGQGLPTSALDKEMQSQVDYGYEIAKESFISDNPELVEEFGEDKMNYSDLYDAGHSDKAEELSELEMDMGDDSIMFELGGYYYDPQNSKAVDKKHTLYIFANVNLEAPYHRHGNLEDFKEITFTFDNLSDMKSILDKEIQKLTAWMNGEEYESSRELKITRMSNGGGVMAEQSLTRATAYNSKDLKKGSSLYFDAGQGNFVEMERFREEYEVHGQVDGSIFEKRFPNYAGAKNFYIEQSDALHVNQGYKSGGAVWIQDAVKRMKKKGTKGAFTRQAKRHGETPIEFAKKVLKRPDNYIERTRQRAQFVKNTNPEKFKEGGAMSEFARTHKDEYHKIEVLDHGKDWILAKERDSNKAIFFYTANGNTVTEHQYYKLYDNRKKYFDSGLEGLKVVKGKEYDTIIEDDSTSTTKVDKSSKKLGKKYREWVEDALSRTTYLREKNGKSWYSIRTTTGQVKEGNWNQLKDFYLSERLKGYKISHKTRGKAKFSAKSRGNKKHTSK